ncbi:hypothetical protein [Actinacidiphila yeochonensis]|uniref:hypothetical protein n=1 Tax=Actinacidiphila yeochonensis TaxID=89050 RepID=UPI0018E34087|nr:hypothetical protein [Actinacidiphila yeochonensis]
MVQPDRVDEHTKFEDTLLGGLGKLITVGRVAGLPLYSNGAQQVAARRAETVQLNAIDAATADALAATLLMNQPERTRVLSAGLASELARRPDGAPEASCGPQAAATHLRVALAVCSVNVEVRPPRAGSSRITLGSADRTAVLRLATLIETGTGRLIRLAEDLRAALLRTGVHVEYLTADRGAVHLAEMSPADGARLLRLLTGTTSPNTARGNTPTTGDEDGPELADRLGAALHRASGATVEVTYEPACLRYPCEPGLLIGPRSRPPPPVP